MMGCVRVGGVQIEEALQGYWPTAVRVVTHWVCEGGGEEP